MPHGQLTVPDAAAWRAWLNENENASDGVWVTLAKKGTHTPTSLTYAQALDEALCSGWIDGRKHAIDTATYRQHFTPRRARSMWSKRNVELVAALTDSGRMRSRGRAEVERAQADGRWDRAYAGAATIEVPEDLLAALQKSPRAGAAFRALGSAARYPILLDVTTASTERVRATRIARHIAQLTTAELDLFAGIEAAGRAQDHEQGCESAKSCRLDHGRDRPDKPDGSVVRATCGA